MLPADSKQVLNALRATPIAPVYNNEYGLYTALPEFQKAQISNPMVDVELKANTTKAENYRASGNIYGEVDFLKHFTFKAMFSMDYASNNGRTYTPIVKVYDAAVNGGSLLWEQARPRSASLKRMKQSSERLPVDIHQQL